MTKPAGKLSVVVLTLNERRNLPACLASVAPLHPQVFVVDSGSTDDTVAIAESAGARVFRHPFEHYGAQRNWAMENLPMETPWTLHLDADERLTPELAEEIRRTLEEDRPGIDGYLLRQRTVFMGRWIKHGGHYPSHHLRLFRTGKGRCENRLYDQHFLVDGKVGRLGNDYIDVVTSDIDSWTIRHLKWARAEAEDILSRQDPLGRVQPKFFGSPIQRRRWLRTGPYAHAPRYLRAFLYWFYRYFLRLGFLDGKEGLIFHVLQGLWFRFMVDVKLGELGGDFHHRGHRGHRGHREGTE